MVLFAKSRTLSSGQKARCRLCLQVALCIMAVLATRGAHARLVADGETRILDNTATNMLFTLVVGTNAPGALLVLQNNTRVTNQNSYIGYNSSSSTNTVVVDGAGSYWKHQEFYLGAGGPFNRLFITNGAIVNNFDCTIGGSSSSSNNSVVVTGSNSVWLVGAVISGKGANNRISVMQGGRISSGALQSWIGDTALVSGAGSAWTNSTVALTIQCSLVVSNEGIVHTTSSATIGNASGVSNRVAVTGTNSLWRHGTLLFSGAPFNHLAITDGGRMHSLSAGVSSVSNLVEVIGPGAVWTNSSSTSFAGFGNQLVISNGGKVVCNSQFTFNAPSSRTTVTGADSELRARTDVRIGQSGGNIHLAITDGASVVANQLFLGGNSASNLLTVTDGTVTVTNGILIGGGAFTLNSGTVKADSVWLPIPTTSRFIFNGGTLQTRCITGGVSQLNIGNGVSPAVFEMLNHGSNSLPVSGMLVASNAWLKGNGVLGGDGPFGGNVRLARGATISPGTSLGTIGVTGSLVLSNGSGTVMELDALAVDSDRINVSGNLTYGGTLQLTNLAGSLSPGNVFTLFSAGTFSGSFNDIVPSTPGPGLKWNTNGLRVDGTLRVAADSIPPPVISNPAFGGSNFTFAVTGGEAYGKCYVLASTNLALPLASWSRIQTNLFDVSGNGNFSIPILTNEPQRHFTVLAE